MTEQLRATNQNQSPQGDTQPAMDSPLLLHQPSFDDDDMTIMDGDDDEEMEMEIEGERIVYVPETPSPPSSPPPPSPKKKSKPVYLRMDNTLIPTRLTFEGRSKIDNRVFLYGDTLRRLHQEEREKRNDLDWDESYLRLRLRRRKRDDRECQLLEVLHRERRFQEYDHDIRQLEKRRMTKQGNDKASAIEVE